MGTPTFPELPPEAAAQQGRFSFDQARAAGWTPHRLSSAVRHGALRHPAHAVYAAGGMIDDPRMAHAAALREVQLGRPGSPAGARRTAAFLHQYAIIGRPPKVPQTLRDAKGTRSHGKERHDRIGSLPGDHVEYVDGLRLTTGARTAIDIARAESVRNGVVVADSVLARFPRSDLEDVLGTMRRWPGITRARWVVAFADGRTESPVESLTRLACHREVQLVPEPQVEVWRWGVFVARVDLLLRGPLLAIESDGAAKFDGPGVLPDLVRRQEALRDCGVDVLRTWWDDVFRDTGSFGDRLRQRLVERGERQLLPGVELRSTPHPHADHDSATPGAA